MFKKALLTLSFMAVIGMITAQSLQFEYEGTVYEEGQTIVCEYDDDMLEYNKKEIHIRNLTDEQQDVIVEKEVIEHLNGTQNYFCWGNCYIPTTIVSDPNPVAANSLSTDDLSFHFLSNRIPCASPLYLPCASAPRVVGCLCFISEKGGIHPCPLSISASVPPAFCCPPRA